MNSGTFFYDKPIKEKYHKPQLSVRHTEWSTGGNWTVEKLESKACILNKKQQINISKYIRNLRDTK
jgi:hypothetical protein